MIPPARDRLRWRPLHSESLRTVLGVMVVYALAWATLYHLQFQTPYLTEPEGYTHLEAAWLMRTGGTLEVFSCAEAAPWRDAWLDRDFGFHLLLVPFTFGELVTGGKLAAVSFGAAVYASLFTVLRLTSVRHAWLWTALLACTGGFFGYRSLVLRPELISMTLSIWAVYFVIGRSWRGTFLVCVAWALLGAAPQLVLGYALLHLIVRGATECRWTPWVLVAAAAGIGAGWLLHPDLPHNVQAWWVHTASGLLHPELALTLEQQPTDTRSFLVEHAVIHLGALGALVLVPRIERLYQPRLLTLFAATNGLLVMSASSRRYIVYFVPLALWLLAELYHQGLPELRSLSRRARAGLAVAVAAVVAWTGGHTWGENTRNFQGLRGGNAEVAATWLGENTPPGSLIFTCDWDDAPELSFFDDSNRYLVFLDPTLMRHRLPGLWRAWRLVAEGQDRDPVLTIRDGLGAEGGYCTGAHELLRQRLVQDPRAEVVGRPGQGYVFRFRGDAEVAELVDAARAGESTVGLPDDLNDGSPGSPP